MPCGARRGQHRNARSPPSASAPDGPGSTRVERISASGEQQYEFEAGMIGTGSLVSNSNVPRDYWKCVPCFRHGNASLNLKLGEVQCVSHILRPD
jgi:hypothetical protein